MKKNYHKASFPSSLKRQIALLAASAGLIASNAAQAQISQIGIMPGHPNTPTIYQPSSSSTANVNFPYALSFDRNTGGDNATFKQIIIPFAANPDNIPTPITGRITSLDGGATWGSVSIPSPNIDAGMTFRKRNGDLITLPFDDGNSFTSYLSTNDGASWSGVASTSNGLQHAHRSFIEEPNGDVYATAYTGAEIRIMRCSAGTNAWTVLGARPMSGGQFSEPTMERCADGSWLVICRQEGPTKEMRWSRSTNQGASWTPHAALYGIPIQSGFLIDVDPHLKLMPNGLLVLSYGSRKSPDWTYCNDKVAFSWNNGTTWNLGQTLFTGAFSLGPPGTMTSGYTAVVPISAHRFMYIGDTGTSWTYNNVAHPSPNPYSLWGKYVDVVRTEQNRIDLKGKYAAGAVTIMPATSLTFTDANYPEARSTAAFDGSTDYWSSAIGNSSGYLYLDLQKSYRITDIGLAMLYGKQQSASIDYSTDGSTWLPTGVNYSNTTHYALNYTNVTDFDARYIRVQVSGTGDVGIGELELYEASSTFENNASSITSAPNGIIPPGWAKTPNATNWGFSVQDGYGYQSYKALKMWDASSSWGASIRKIVSTSNTKTLEFRCRIAALPTGTSFNVPIMGTVSGVAEQTVFWVAAFASTSTTAILKVNSGSGWVQLGTATLPISGTVWKHIKIVANESANTATLFIDGVQQGGTFGMFASPAAATTLSGFGFNSNGSATSGEVVYFDDVNLYDPNAGGGPSGFSAMAPQTLMETQQAEADRAMVVSVSPNPVTDVATISITNTVQGDVEIELHNLYGKKLRSQRYETPGGTFETSIPVGDLPTAAMYVVTVKHNNTIVKTKLIK